MCEIIDFQSRRTAFLHVKAKKCAEMSNERAARVEWLRRSEAPLVDVVKASLEAERADHECREFMQALNELKGPAPSLQS